MSSSDVRMAYDRWAGQYDRDENATRELNARVLRDQLDVGDSDRVLEVGCGTGINTEWLVERAGRVTAVDISASMLDRLAERLSGCALESRRMDLTDPWPFDDARFDWVIATLVLEHVENLEQVFEKACRVLRDGGQLYISELHPYRQLEGTQANFCDEETGEEVVVPAYPHTVSEFVNGGLAAGLSVREMREWQAPGDDEPRLLTVRYRVEGERRQ